MKPPIQFLLAGALAGLCSATASAGRITIVSESDSAKLWSPAPGVVQVRAGYPTTVADRAQDVCVNIGYLINANGTTSDFTQMKAWSSVSPGEEPKPELVQPFVQSAAAAVSMWRLASKSARPKSIYTSATFVFSGGKSMSEEALGAKCRIDNLQAHVAQAQQAKYGNRDSAREERQAEARSRELMAKERQY